MTRPPSTWSIAAHQSQTLPADDICAVPVDITWQYHVIGSVLLVVGPSLSQVWNSLPDSLRDPALSSDCFRQVLKTNLFLRYHWVHTAQLRCFVALRYINSWFTLTLTLTSRLMVSLTRTSQSTCGQRSSFAVVCKGLESLCNFCSFLIRSSVPK